MEATNCLPEIQGSSHFFKTILPSTLEPKMLNSFAGWKIQKIPQKIVTKFGDDLSSVATITVPNGRVWKFGVVKERGKVWFGNGWSEFVEYFSIGPGHLLVFQFKSNSNFHVVIFDMTAFEIEYPVSDGEEPENVRQNFEHQNNMESDEERSVEFLGSTAPNSSFRILGNNFKDKSTRAGLPRNVYSPMHKNEPRRAA
ncbi:hypothetical protein Pint_34187 [Pistacia integerrima]|uniref:Uncharacterized protein n=1 Tax=Pistacia integerrima TaxID=434235 RepID=A0ACC0X8M1_9ROSI|nr:hypothetical protein Pint_34187 [Pistacia integerrima]